MKDPKTGKRPRIKIIRERLPDSVIEEAKEKFMGKRVRLKNYKGVTGIHDVVGKVTYLGYNKLIPGWDLMACIGTLPCSNISLKQMTIEEDNTIRVIKK